MGIEELRLFLYYLQWFVENHSFVENHHNTDLFWENKFEKIISWYMEHVNFFSGAVSGAENEETSRCPYRHFQIQIDKYVGYSDNSNNPRQIDNKYINHIRLLERVKEMSELAKSKKGEWKDMINMINLYDSYLSRSPFKNHFRVLYSLSDAYWGIPYKYYNKSITLTQKSLGTIDSLIDVNRNRLELQMLRAKLDKTIDQRKKDLENLWPIPRIYDYFEIGLVIHNKPIVWLIRFDLIFLFAGILNVLSNNIYKQLIQHDSSKPSSHAKTDWAFAILGCLAGVGNLYLIWLARTRPFKIY